MDNYKFIKQISRGAYFNCNLYKNKSKYYAIKTNIENEIFGDCELKELISLLKINYNPNIISLNEIFLDTNEKVNLVYDYYPETLYSFINRTSIEERMKYLYIFLDQILNGIYSIHINKMIHTDIKPSNIVLKCNGNNINFKIIDFSCCYIDNITKKNSLVSTYIIRAPEVYKYDSIYDNKIDIWSFGATLYYYMTGNEILNSDKHDDSTDLDKIKDIYNFVQNIDTINLHPKYLLLLKSMLKLNPDDRLNINDLINLCDSLFNLKINKNETSKYIMNIPNNNKLFNLNMYVNDKLFDVEISNLTFGNIIIYKIKRKLTNLDLVTIWYLNYKITGNIYYTLNDFLPIFYSYFNQIFTVQNIKLNSYDILESIEFNIF